MKFSIVLSNSKYAKFEKAYNKRLPYTCKGFKINLIQSSSDSELFSITNGVSETYIDIQHISMNFYNDYILEGNSCIISITNINPVDITLKTKTGWVTKLKKLKKIFKFTFK
jgi:hypothetical protein